MATRKGKTSDWRLRNIDRIPTREELAHVRCPSEVFPETKDTVPAQFSENVRHLTTPQENAPWTGYYVTLNGAKLAVTNVYGVWFEIRRQKNFWEAHRVARAKLKLFGDALHGIDIPKLIESGEPSTRPLPRTDQGKKGRNPPPAAIQPAKDAPFGSFVIQSSRTERDSNPRQPEVTGYDPFTPADLWPGYRKGGHIELEGSPPDRYEGDRERATIFLMWFKGFMLMNEGATIARDPIRLCAYFLSLIDGPMVEAWVDRKHEWLKKVKQDPKILPHGMSAWGVLEADFCRMFVDSAERERAQNDLIKSKMKNGEVDERISSFERLTHRAGIGLSDPESFGQWACAAQRQQWSWPKQAVKAHYGTFQPLQDSRNHESRTGGFFSRYPGQNAQGKTSTNTPHPRLPPQDEYMKDAP
jgi:hypothetical protein